MNKNQPADPTHPDEELICILQFTRPEHRTNQIVSIAAFRCITDAWDFAKEHAVECKPELDPLPGYYSVLVLQLLGRKPSGTQTKSASSN